MSIFYKGLLKLKFICYLEVVENNYSGDDK